MRIKMYRHIFIDKLQKKIEGTEFKIETHRYNPVSMSIMGIAHIYIMFNDIELDVISDLDVVSMPENQFDEFIEASIKIWEDKLKRAHKPRYTNK